MNNTNLTYYVVTTIGIIVSRHSTRVAAQRKWRILGTASHRVVALDYIVARGRLIVGREGGVSTVDGEALRDLEQADWLWRQDDVADKARAALPTPLDGWHEEATSAQMKVIYELAVML